MIIVTGGAGMIGSNIIKALNYRGHTNILVVDNLENGTKFANLADLNIADYIDKKEFIRYITLGKSFKSIEVVFHEGACSKTTKWNGKYMMKNNYQYSKHLLDFCIFRKIPFLYASSGAVYGDCNGNCIEERQYEHPLNIYGYSKMLFDHHVRHILTRKLPLTPPICGLRYFNVYGPREEHKRRMASMVFHLNSQIENKENLKLFEGSDNFKRDFIYVDDVVSVNLWCWENNISGIYNCGTGHAESFYEVANIVIKFQKKGEIEYIPFPKNFRNRYQQFTQANLSKLYQAGYSKPFKRVTEGIVEYISQIKLKNNGK